jgi:hypothetical protein
MTIPRTAVTVRIDPTVIEPCRATWTIHAGTVTIPPSTEYAK